MFPRHQCYQISPCRRYVIEDNKEALTGKTSVSFVSSGGSTIQQSDGDMAKDYPFLKVGKGILMNDVSDVL